MKKRVIGIIIASTALALIGILIIQVYWMRNAYRLQEELFDNSVSVTLKSVVNRMFDERNTADCGSSICNSDCDRRTLSVIRAINPAKLDSLLDEEFGDAEITRQYAWGVFDPVSGTFFSGENNHLRPQILESGHKVSLSCLYRTEHLMLGIFFPNESEMLLWKILPWMIISLILMLAVVAAFTFMIFSFMKQKKLSQLKSDFVNNMTHELKTPISTISLASEMLLNPKSHISDDKTRKYAKMIFDENQRLQQQVDQVLQISILEKGAFKIETSTFDVHKVIKQSISRFELIVRNSNGTIRFKPQAEVSEISTDINHFQNVVCNLLDNAVKYSGNAPDITVETAIKNEMLVISVSDKGIGISSENQRLIFDKLYRVPTGNVHDVKGYGIGLYYVKTIIDALGGEVKVKSEPSKGSIFEVLFPLKVSIGINEL